MKIDKNIVLRDVKGINAQKKKILGISSTTTRVQ